MKASAELFRLLGENAEAQMLVASLREVIRTQASELDELRQKSRTSGSDAEQVSEHSCKPVGN